MIFNANCSLSTRNLWLLLWYVAYVCITTLLSLRCRGRAMRGIGMMESMELVVVEVVVVGSEVVRVGWRR